MMKTALAAAAFAALALPVHAATLASWVSVNGVSLAPTTLAPGVSGGTIVRGTGLEQTTGDTFNSQDWTVGGDALVAAQDGDVLLLQEITFARPVDLSSIHLAFDRSPTGPKAISILVAVNRAFLRDFFVDTAVAEDSTSIASLDLSAFDDVTTFALGIYGFDALSDDGTLDLENRLPGGHAVVLTGELPAAAVVPLPAAGLFLLGGLGGLAILKRRRAA